MDKWPAYARTLDGRSGRPLTHSLPTPANATPRSSIKPKRVTIAREMGGAVASDLTPEIALQQLRQALADGVPPAPVLIDPAYGNNSKLRAAISELGLTYVAGILPTTMVWRPGEAPLPPTPRTGRGRPGKRMRRDATHQPVSAKTLALELAANAWQQIKWRDGSNTPLVSRFARWRVRPARDERDYLELKQEVGLGHYEGRGWRGFHHHASLCIAAYGFLISEKETIPPSGPART